MSETLSQGPFMRRALLVVAFLLLAPLSWLVLRDAQLPLFDFVEYWAAGRLCAEGENPYDPDAVEQLEKQAGREEPGVLMWNPPWTLLFVLPFGLADVHLAHLLWLAVQFAALAVSADRLWLFFGGSCLKRWVAWLLALTFAPCHFALTAGQISPLQLLGVVLFLKAEHARKPVLAGLATLLLAIKPHLVLLVWIVLLLDELRQKRWALLASGVGAGVAATLVAMAFRPGILGDYLHTLTANPPAQYDSPTLGRVLRAWLGREHFWPQWLPPIAGMLWGVWYWSRHRADWRWRERLPLLLLVSLLTAAYGAWPFDLVLLLVPVVQIAVCPRHVSVAVPFHVLFNGAAVALLVLGQVEFFWFLWMTPALLAGYLLSSPRLRRYRETPVVSSVPQDFS